jgi:hypothetical protein
MMFNYSGVAYMNKELGEDPVLALTKEKIELYLLRIQLASDCSLLTWVAHVRRSSTPDVGDLLCRAQAHLPVSLAPWYYTSPCTSQHIDPTGFDMV